MQKEDYLISLEDFKEISDTGDILFFKSKTISGKMQRFFAHCNFDHVAIILKYKNNMLYVFESTGTNVNQNKFVKSWNRVLK